MSYLSNQAVIVTGSSSGIGEGIAKHFANQGADVVINSRVQERGERVAESIRDIGGSAIAIEADITDDHAVEILVKKTVEKFGSLDVMVNNAGMTILDPAEDFKIDEWRQVVEVNLVGTFICCQAAGRQMIKQNQGGSILNISSLMGGDHGLQLRSPYCASKAGVNNLTKTLAVEWADEGVCVNALAPGFVRTNITGQTQDSAGYTDDDIRDRTPLGRFGTVEEMAKCAEFLVSRDNFVTGEVLYADGGYNAYAWGASAQR
jgi:3-oxoacyl-[acyl-carrier protein] reductase